MALDIKTIFLLITIVTGLMAAALFYAFAGSFRKGEGLLPVILILHALASVLIGARGMIPDILSMHVSVVAYSVAFSLSYAALCRFFRLRIRWAVVLGPVITIAALTPLFDVMSGRAILAGAIFGTQHVFVIVTLVIIRSTHRFRALNLIFLCNIIACITFYSRALLALADPASFESIFTTSAMQTMTMVVLFTSLLFYMLGFLLLHLEWESDKVFRTNRELDERNRSLKEGEDLLKVALDAAQAASRAKSEFLANMSHEIRTPMNAILGFTELLRQRMSGPRERDYIEAIDSSGKTLMGLITDLLDLSRVEAGRLVIQPAAVDLRDIVYEIKRSFSAVIEDKSLAFGIAIDPLFPSQLYLDPLRMRQILNNLVGNAVKFTGSGMIALKIIRLRRAATSRSDIVISVADTGMGIAASELESIFESFHQQKGQDHARYGGAGLGLTITRRIIEHMGGTISVESEPGRGSLFTVFLPDIEIAPEEEAAGEMAALPGHGLLRSATVLVADDNELNRKLLRLMCEQYGLAVREASDGSSALEMALSLRPDIILMDMKMPGMDGYEATTRIRQSADIGSVPVIAVTAAIMPENEDRARAAGCDGVIGKPVDGSELWNELVRFLGR